MGIEARHREGGFTLIELMIVMVVLGILAGIVIFKVGAFRDSAAAATCRSDVRSLATANAAYMVKHGTNAPDVDALVSEGYIKSAPASGLAFTDGHTTPATPDGCDASSASGTTSSTTSSSVPSSVGVAALGGTTHHIGHTNDWTATVTVSVADQASSGVDGVQVSGSWSDGSTPSSCTTDASGGCSFTSPHTTTNAADARTWTVSSVSKAGYGAGSNAATAVTCRRTGAPDGNTVCTPS